MVYLNSKTCSFMSFNILKVEDLKKEEDRLEALYQYNILDSEYEEAYDKIVEIAVFISGTTISLITILDTNRHWVKAKIGLGLDELPTDALYFLIQVQNEEFNEVTDALNDDRYNTNSLVTGHPYIRFYAGVQLKTMDGHNLGTICIMDKKPGKLTGEQIKHLKTLAHQVVVQMELKKLNDQLAKLNVGLMKELEKKFEEQKKVLSFFSRFVPNEIVTKHLMSVEEDYDDAELKTLTVLFCDIRGYTPIVEALEPSEAVSILKLYYNIMSDVITSFSGMVNQYVGDEIFGTFGSPFSELPYELNAVLCAIGMMEKLKLLNQQCRQFTQEEIKIGIGIHTGNVITGTLGSKEKIEYSVTGDTVNTGKRIESITQSQPNTILISYEVFEKVKQFINVKHWNPIYVKGKTLPIHIFEVLGKK